MAKGDIGAQGYEGRALGSLPSAGGGMGGYQPPGMAGNMMGQSPMGMAPSFPAMLIQMALQRQMGGGMNPGMNHGGMLKPGGNIETGVYNPGMNNSNVMGGGREYWDRIKGPGFWDSLSGNNAAIQSMDQPGQALNRQVNQPMRELGGRQMLGDQSNLGMMNRVNMGPRNLMKSVE